MKSNWKDLMELIVCAAEGPFGLITSNFINSTYLFNPINQQPQLRWLMDGKRREKRERRMNYSLRSGWLGLLVLVSFLCGALAGPPAHNPQRKKPTPTALQFHPQKKFHFHFFCWIPFQLAAGRWAPWGGVSFIPFHWRQENPTNSIPFHLFSSLACRSISFISLSLVWCCGLVSFLG